MKESRAQYARIVQLRNVKRKFKAVSERKPRENFQMRPLQLKISPPQGGWSGETEQKIDNLQIGGISWNGLKD